MPKNPPSNHTNAIHKILIANRGEIAARVIRTCQKMGIQTVAVYSDADADLDFVKLADESVLIGPASAKDSYLNIPKLIEVCQQLQVDAVHPGYGFLSENAEFAEALHRAGILFIGPEASAIRAMGSKSEAKSLAEQANIPTIPGYRGEDQSLGTLQKKAQEIGYPVLIKATHGGGGKGMRRVDSSAEFEMALSACQREAQSAFSNDKVMLEKYVLNPRHIEVQIFGDTHGAILALSERDCSLQRRHQKIIEEAPAAGLSDDIRLALHRDAVAIAKAVKYTGAGTVEFLVSQDESYYFLEMNTRLQVEHPVTEEILGLDLVEWQIRVTRGEHLPLKTAPIPKGHALEVRLYAEDPYAGFLPSTGLIRRFEVDLQGARLDAGFRAGNRVSVHYDPMLAKLIVHGASRREAYAQLSKTLATVSLVGIKSNRDFLLRLCHLPEVVAQLPDIGFLDRSLELILAQPTLEEEGIVLLGVGLLAERSLVVDSSVAVPQPLSPWDIKDDWRECGLTQTRVEFRASQPGGLESVHVLSKYGQQWFLDASPLDMANWWANSFGVGCTFEGRSIKADRVMSPSGSLQLLMKGCLYGAEILDLDHQAEAGTEDQSHLNAPMPGRVISVLVIEGQSVEAGAPLVILEAMKMEHTIRAPYTGVVEQVFFSTGDFVEEGAELTRVRAA